MKILLASRLAYPRIGGVENSLRFIGRELLDAGHEVKVLCLRFSPDEPRHIRCDGIEIIGVPCKSKRWPHQQLQEAEKAIASNALDLLSEFQPDAVWSRSVPISLGIRQVGYQGPLLHIFSTNARMNAGGTFLQTKGLPLRRRLLLLGLWPFSYFSARVQERRLSRQCTLIAFSRNMLEVLLNDLPQDVNCHLIPPGVDCEFFSPKNGQQYINQIEKEYGLQPDEMIVLYVGRLSNAKHIPMLMDALNSLKFPVKLVLVGTGPEKERLKNYASRIGLADRLLFAGVQREKLPGFYAISRVCVLSTTVESFGQVYLEALASGTPAVGFAGDGHRVLTATDDIIQDGMTGAIARTVSAQALGDKIRSILLLNNEDYAAMSKRARADMQQRFSWKRFVSAALELSHDGVEVSKS